MFDSIYKNMISIKTNFNLRDRKAVSTKVHLICRWANQKLTFPTDINIEVDSWEFTKQRPKTKYPQYLETKTRLDNIENIAINSFRTLINDAADNYLPNIDELRSVLNQKINGTILQVKQKNLDFFDFVESLIKERKESINPKTSKPYSINQVKYYKVTLDKIREFVGTKRIRNFNYENINLEFHRDFTKFLRQQNYSTNYIGNHIKILKLFLNESRERGFHNFTEHTKKGFTKPSEVTDKIYLTIEELDQIEKTDLSNNKRLDNVRDLLIVGAWTGLRFGDFTNISQKDIYLDTDDGDYIEIKTSKTGRIVVIPILPMVRRIIEKYSGKTPNSLPRPISNQRFNEYVKEVGELAGIDEPISLSITKGGLMVTQNIPKYNAMSSHCCRRSFATNAYQMGVPTLTIREITGHDSESAFLLYIRATPKEHANKMREIMMKRFESKLKIA
jgi:integrase